MPICQNCGNKWTWKQTIKTIFKLRCPHCGQKQYESTSSRIRSGIFGLLPVMLLPVNAWLDFSVGMVLTMAVMLVLIILGFYPFILKLSNGEEPYW
ncbi:TIGR04104 family putative zinc finger protein [Lentibacillus salicampi]|uniref:Cxxc_20_cxxc protein n=1 Tax=Lentibacillus salicampi TaxID=175306 RepID=A0A4Y9AA53_9BACI|nr:TIGR04104 family putative zinc finger protein [Lentibacillus salicampi]TFJ91211.1 hypothetical protein E4U82_18900 [Lentibacillus salicampi]